MYQRHSYKANIINPIAVQNFPISFLHQHFIPLPPPPLHSTTNSSFFQMTDPPTSKPRKPLQIVCSLCGEVPEQPVVSRKSGHIFEKRLIERALLASNNVCPETGQPLTLSDLIPVKATGAVVQPVATPRDDYSVPAALQYAMEQWDITVLELHQVKTGLLDTKKELATALYRLESAERLIAQLRKENNELGTLNSDYASRVAEARRVAEEQTRRAETVAAAQAQAAATRRTEAEVSHTSAAKTGPKVTEGEKREDIHDVDKAHDVQETTDVAGRRGGVVDSNETAVGAYDANSEQMGADKDTTKDVKVAAEELRFFPQSLLEQTVKRSEELQTKRKARFVPEEHANATMVGSFSEVRSVKVDEGEVGVTSIAISGDEIAYAGTSSGKIVGIDLEKMRREGTEIMGHEDVKGGVCRVRWDAEGARLISAGGDGAVKVWDGGREVAMLQHTDAVVDFGMHTVGGIVLVVLEGGGWLWRDLGSSGAVVCEGEGEGVNMSGAVHPDGLVFGTGRGDGVVDLWDARIMKCVASLGEKGAGVRMVEMSEKGYYMASAAGDEVKLWDLRKSNSNGSVRINGGAFAVGFDGIGEFGCAVGRDSVRLFAGKKKAKLLADVAFESDAGGDISSRFGCAWGAHARYVLVGGRGAMVRKFGGGVE